MDCCQRSGAVPAAEGIDEREGLDRRHIAPSEALNRQLRLREWMASAELCLNKQEHTGALRNRLGMLEQGLGTRRFQTMRLIDHDKAYWACGWLLTAECEECGRCHHRRINMVAIKRLDPQGALQGLDALKFFGSI